MGRRNCQPPHAIQVPPLQTCNILHFGALWLVFRAFLTIECKYGVSPRSSPRAADALSRVTPSPSSGSSHPPHALEPLPPEAEAELLLAEQIEHAESAEMARRASEIMAEVLGCAISRHLTVTYRDFMSSLG